jgi:ribosome-associated heat shock protein Hsp15
MRIDKWLWAARFFKTRALASKACDLGRVEWNGQAAKPSRLIQPGAMLRIKTQADEFEVEVLALSEIRGPAATAQALYRETAGSVERRKERIEQYKAMAAVTPIFDTRPSKRDRRELDRFRNR